MSIGIVYLLVLGPLLIGYALRGRLRDPDAWAGRLYIGAFYLCNTPLALLAVWKADLSGERILLPFMALSGWLIAAPVGIATAKWLYARSAQKQPALVPAGAPAELSEEQAAAATAEDIAQTRARVGGVALSFCLSNNGFTLLGLLALALYGRQGLSQAIYAQTFSAPFVVTVGFTIGRWFGRNHTRPTIRQLLWSLVADQRNIPLVMIALGVALNQFGIAQPPQSEDLIPWLVWTGTLASGIGVGLNLHIQSLRTYWRESALAVAWRLTIFPLFYLAIGLAFGLDPLNLRILVLFGLVPAALLANLVAHLFKLDYRLTTSVWVITTLFFFAIVLPVWVWLAR